MAWGSISKHRKFDGPLNKIRVWFRNKVRSNLVLYLYFESNHLLKTLEISKKEYVKTFSGVPFVTRENSMVMNSKSS